MPISASQHRLSTGNYQNQNYKKTNGNIAHLYKVTPNQSTLPEEIRYFTSPVMRVRNFQDVLNTPSKLPHDRPSVAATVIQFMLLFNQVRRVDYPTLSAKNPLSFMPEKEAILSVSDHTLPLDIGNNGLNAIWSPVVNVLNDAGKFISQHDPLKFPGADATQLCASSHLPDDFVDYMNTNGMYVVARGLEQLKCIENDKYEFFKGTVYNTIKLLDSAIQQLADKKNNGTDNYLRYYGFVDVDDIKPRLIPLYEMIKSEINDTLKYNRASIYYGYGNSSETEKVYAMVKLNDKKKRILLTDNFFGTCTVNAVNVLIHEMSHFHTKFDLFHVLKEELCINQMDGSEMAIHAQLDDASDSYARSVSRLKGANIVINEHISLIYNINKTEFLEKFNTNKTVREEAVFINADSISHLAIALGNYGFKRNNTMPLFDTSEFKTAKSIEGS